MCGTEEPCTPEKKCKYGEKVYECCDNDCTFVENCNDKDGGTCATAKWKCDVKGKVSTFKAKYSGDDWGCSNGSCVIKSAGDLCNPPGKFLCPYGCDEPSGEGDCYPKAAIVTTPALSGGQVEITKNSEVIFECKNPSNPSEDPEGAAISCSWNFGAGEGTANGDTVNHTFATVGSYTVELTVTAGSLSNTAQVIVNVTETNEPPVACFTVTPSSGIVGVTEFTFDASCSTDDGSIVSYDWDFGYEKGGITVTGSGKVIKHVFDPALQPSDAPYTVRLTVTDDGLSGDPSKALSATKEKTITVKNSPPVADFEVIPGNTGFAPFTVKTINKTSDPDSDGHSIAKIEWYKDGVLESTADSMSAVFNGSGNIKLYVEDEYGASSEKTEQILAKNLVSITGIVANNVLTGNDVIITPLCNKDAMVSIEVKSVPEQPGLPSIATHSCNVPWVAGKLGIGAYQAKARVLGGNCDKCENSATFKVFEETPQIESPEMHPLLVLVVLTAVLFVMRNRKNKSFN